MAERASERALRVALEYVDQSIDPKTGLVKTPTGGGSERETVYGALVFLLSGQTERAGRAREMLAGLGELKGHFSLCAMLLAEQKMGDLFDDDMRRQLDESLRARLDEPEQDIIAGRNINLPLQTWTVRLAAGLRHNRPDHVDGAVRAIEELTALVRAHGSLPEYNSPVYHVITVECLHIIAGLGEPRSALLAERLRVHLWEEMAWRFHPRLGVLCGPWGRQYQDGFDGAGANAEYLMDQVWGAYYDETLPYVYDHAHDFVFAALLGLIADDAPMSARAVAKEKPLPLTVYSQAEQVDYLMGEEWAPGGVAELTSWMDENRAVGTASRGHVHGMQSGIYVAHWSRTGEPVSAREDLGIAFTRFVQNGRRPGETHFYRSHHHGKTTSAGNCLWADDGRGTVLQSGPTAVITYTPKAQERGWVKTFEALMVVPCPESVDALLVDGEPWCGEAYEGDPSSSVVVRSGTAALGLRFTACDAALTQPRLCIERGPRHFFIGLRLVDFEEERALPLSTYRRYGASIGAELRWAPTEDDVVRLVADMQGATLRDNWWMGDPPHDFGGPRKLEFTMGGKTLGGHYAPVAGAWLQRSVPEPDGHTQCLVFEG